MGFYPRFAVKCLDLEIHVVVDEAVVGSTANAKLWLLESHSGVRRHGLGDPDG